MAERQVKITILGDAGPFSKAVQEADTAAEGLGSKLKAVFGGIGATVAAGVAAAGAALAGVGVAAFKLGESFDAAYDTIRVGTGATGDALEGLKEDFRAVAARVPVDFAQVGTAIADLNTRMGVSGPLAQSLAEQFLNLGRITGVDVQSLIAQGSRAFADWGISAEDAGGKLDFLFKVSQSTGIGVDRLMQLVTQSGAALRETGFDFETGAALLGQFEKAGVNTEQALMGLNRAVSAAAREGKPAQQAIQEIFDQIRNAKDPTEATKIAVEAFGTRAGPELASAIRSGQLDVQKLVETLKASGETINGVASETDDFAQKWQLLKNQLALAAEPLANTVFGLAGSIVERLTPALTSLVAEAGPKLEEIFTSIGTWIDGTALPALQRFAGWFTTTALPAIQSFLSGAWQQLKQGLTEAWTTIDTQILPALQRFSDWFTTTALPAIQGFATQVQPLLQPILDFFQSQFSTILLTVLGAIAVAFAAWAVSAAAAAAATIAALLPVIAPIAAIGVAVALLKAAWENNWGGIRDKLQAVWSFIQPTLQAIFDHLATFWQEIQPKLQAAWDAIKNNIQTTVENIRTVVTTVFDAVKGFIERHGDEIKTILEGAWKVIEGVVKTVTAVIEGIIKTVLDVISGNWSGAWEDIKETANRVWEGIKQIVDGAIQMVKGFIQIGLDEAKRIWDSIWDGVQRKIDEIKTSVTTTVQNLISEIKGAFSGSIDWLWQAGRDIVQGLIDGLSSLLGEVRRKAEEIASTVKNAVSSALDILSPSRVMFELGQLTGEGFLLGLDATLGQPFPVPVPEVVGAPAGSGLTVTVHIGTVVAADRRSVEQAGQDVAYAIAEALRRRGIV